MGEAATKAYFTEEFGLFCGNGGIGSAQSGRPLELGSDTVSRNHDFCIRGGGRRLKEANGKITQELGVFI